MTPVIESIPGVLRERASLQPNDTAFTFIDYEQDWEGVAENRTWSQMYRRTLNLAHELRLRGSVGDRAVILAPQGSGRSRRFSAHCRRDLSRFRFRFRWAAPMMSASVHAA